MFTFGNKDEIDFSVFEEWVPKSRCCVVCISVDEVAIKFQSSLDNLLAIFSKFRANLAIAKKMVRLKELVVFGEFGVCTWRNSGALYGCSSEVRFGKDQR